MTFSRLMRACRDRASRRRLAKQSGGDAGEEVPAAPRRQKRHRFLRELREVLIRAMHVAEAIAAQHGCHGRVIGMRIENQVGLGSRRFVVALKGLVQQVVEDDSVQIGLCVQVMEKRVERVDEQ